ncbi:MAG: hypothetical protein M1815_000982, partial [Lichina confinis]
LRPELKLKVLEKVPNMTNRAGIVQATIAVEVSLQMSTQQDRGSGTSGHVWHSGSSQLNWQFQGQLVDPSKSKEKDPSNPNTLDHGVSQGSSFHTGAGQGRGQDGYILGTCDYCGKHRHHEANCRKKACETSSKGQSQ